MWGLSYLLLPKYHLPCKTQGYFPTSTHYGHRLVLHKKNNLYTNYSRSDHVIVQLIRGSIGTLKWTRISKLPYLWRWRTNTATSSYTQPLTDRALSSWTNVHGIPTTAAQSPEKRKYTAWASCSRKRTTKHAYTRQQRSRQKETCQQTIGVLLRAF